MKKTLLLISALFFFLPAFAQQEASEQPEKANQFSISTQHWTRGEWRDGGMENNNGKDMALFVMSSTQLSFNYKYKGLEVMFAPKHIGVWGAKGSGGINLEEGWFSLTHKKGLFLKLGRQHFAYDDERIIGTDDWVMTTNRHDALKMGLEMGKHKLHLLFAYNQNDENTNGGTYYVDGAQTYKMMQTLWYHFDPWPQFGASLLFMNTGMQNLMTEDDVTNFQQLLGAYLDWTPGPFSLQGSYYRQMGIEEHELPIHAWMMSAEAAWKINARLRLNGGYFHMSGDPYFFVPPDGSIGMMRKTEVCGFNPIFGSHHKFYGAMDFFYVSTYYGGNTPGLQDWHLGAKWSPFDPWSIDATYHYLATSVKIPGDYKRGLGHEIELSTSWKIMKDVSLSAGYSYMHGTETMKVLKRSSSENKNRLHWGWIMISVTPEFFKIKW